jgi:manganese/iron transport system ATP-binding protein
MNVLQVSDLTVELAGRQVLHDVNLRVAPSEQVGLIGPNGAGKTTVFNLITGLLKRAARSDTSRSGTSSSGTTRSRCGPR